MAVLNLALLSLLLPAVLARPQIGHGVGHSMFHGPHERPFPTGSGVPVIPNPSGIHGGPPKHHHHSAPYPAHNVTAGGPSASGVAKSTGGAGASSVVGASSVAGGNGGQQTVTSIISVVPVPVTTDVYGQSASAQSNGAGNNSPASVSAGVPGSPSGSGGVGGAGASQCGPATVTVTAASTITVTVSSTGGAGGAGASSPTNAGPAPSSAKAKPTLPSSPPYPIGNSSVPVGPTGQTGAPSPSPAKATPSTVEPVMEKTDGQIYNAAATSTPAAASSPAAAASPAAYVAKEKTPAPQEKTVAPQEKVAVHQPHHQPPQGGPHGGPPKSPPHGPPAPVSSPSSPSAPSQSSSPAPNGSIKRGITYGMGQLEQASALPGITWGTDWDSSVTPGAGMSVGSANFQFVPQLWGPDQETHLKFWDSNAAGHPYLLFYNEPMMGGTNGPNVDANQAAKDFNSYMLPKQKAGAKVSTPCVANSQGQYMQDFLSNFQPGAIDVMCFHWYGNDISGLQSTVEEFSGYAQKAGIKEIWLSEWAVQPTPQDLSPYVSYLDGKLDRYAYNLNDMGAGQQSYCA